MDAYADAQLRCFDDYFAGVTQCPYTDQDMKTYWHAGQHDAEQINALEEAAWWDGFHAGARGCNASAPTEYIILFLDDWSDGWIAGPVSDAFNLNTLH